MQQPYHRDPEIERVHKLARVLDDYFLDPLLGLLLPGAGDVIGALLGIYTITIAARRGVSPVVIARMLMNLAVDTVVGVIPLAGDAFDVGFKANRRNAALLAERVGTGGRATARDWLVVVGAALVYVGVLALVIWAAVALVRAIR